MAQQITRTTKSLLSDKQIITKASVVTHQLYIEHGLQVRDWEVRKIFRERLGLRYKRVKRIAFKGNTDKNLYLRQRFGMRLIELLQAGKRVLGVDETWLGDTQFVRRKWAMKGSTFS